MDVGTVTYPGDAFQADGFKFGAATVTASASFQRKAGEGRSVVIAIDTDAGRSLTVYVSPTGRSVRVFLGHEELT